MKPTKNHFYCVACHRAKMLFETQAKADNFIRYNAAEMLRAGTKAPVRSYYCTLCGGWHVTSNPSIEDGERLDQRDNELVKRIEAKKTAVTVSKKVKVQLSEITTAVDRKLREYILHASCCDFDAAEALLHELAVSEQSDLEDMGAKHAKVLAVLKRINAAKGDLALRRNLYAMSREELQLLEKDNADPTVSVIAHNSWRIRAMREVLASDAGSVSPDVLKQCLTYLPEIKGDFSNHVKNELRKQLEALMPPSPMPAVGLKKPNRSLNAHDYRTTILELISRVEGLSEVYAAGHYAECSDRLEVCYFILNEFGADDENTKIIRTRLDQWQCLLGHPN